MEGPLDHRRSKQSGLTGDTDLTSESGIAGDDLPVVKSSRETYRAWKAGAAARESRSRPKERKIDTDPALRDRVAGDLKKGWSPEQIAGRLRYEHNRGETDMPVSHETIYTWIYAQPKGELARAGIILRTGREQRKPRGRKKSTGAKIVGMRSIDERPAE